VAQLFVSHSSADNAFAEKLLEALGALGYESVFLDFDPDAGLVPGKAWREQLFTNIDASDALVFVTTPASIGSKWCHSELALARWLRKPILSLLVDDSDPHELTADLQGLKVSAAEIDRERLRAALTDLGLDQTAAWDASRSPFPGLRAFDESYAAVFFGRDRQIEQLRQLVDPPSRVREGAIVPVLGPSGSGKSSLVRAGLVPALRPSPDWVISDPWTPTDAPLAEMALALAHAAKNHQVDLDATRCAELLKTPGGMTDYVRELRDAGSLGADTKVLVVMDQAEELVTMTPDVQRQEFLEALNTSCAAPSPLRVVMTARTDMWDRVSAETARFTMAVAPTVLHVTPLSRSDLAEIIREPAKRSHLTLEDGLVQRLVEDTGSGDALPLLAFTLNRMAADATDGRLTHAAYDAIGGVQGAIASRAAEVAHGGRTEQDVAESILHLVNLDEAKPYKRLARAADISPAHREILDDLVDARLVVVSSVNDQDVYAPAHEALFWAWPPLVDLIEHRRDDLRLRGRLERRATDWREGGATTSGLLSGLELDQAREWRTRNADLATADIAAYVDASARREVRGRVLRSAVSALVVALVVTLVVVLILNGRAEERRATQARVGELAAIAERELVDDPAAAATALLEGFELDPGDDELEQVARQLLTSSALDVIREKQGTSLVGLGAGGSTATVVGTSGVIVWDTDGARQVRADAGVNIVAMSRDDRYAAFSDPDSLSLQDVSGDETVELSRFGESSTLLGFSPDGTKLGSVIGNTIKLWDVSDPGAPTEIGKYSSTGRSVTAISVRDDGRVFFSGTVATLQVWDSSVHGLDDPGVETIVSIPPGSSPIQYIDVDDAEQKALLDTPTAGAGVVVVELADGQRVGSYIAQDPAESDAPAITWMAAMNHAGDRVATFDLGGRGFAFDTADGSFAGPLVGHSSLVVRAAFLDNGRLVSTGIDGTIRLWDTEASARKVGGSLPDALCDTFGSRIDEDSWALAMEDRTFDPPCSAD
jgi:energy-coupling factor transporter ATP-binding protein EcfA2